MMKNKLKLNLQILQDAYSSLCGLTVMITNQQDERLTEPSGMTDMVGLLLDFQSNSLEDSIVKIMGKVQGIPKPIVYETITGFKLLVAPITTRGRPPYYIIAGVMIDRSIKELIAARIYETLPSDKWQDWTRALDGVAAYNKQYVENLLNQLDSLAGAVTALLEHEQEDNKALNNLQLLNLVNLMDSASPVWMQGVLDIFVRVMGLEFAGYASNLSNDEQYTVIETTGIHIDNPLMGASFFLGEGFLGQVGLSKQMGYWEKSDRDPRISFFTSKGIKPKVIICYPVKYKNRLFGLLFGGDSLRQELSEEQADLGMLLAQQLSSSIYHLDNEATYERRRMRIEAFVEISRTIVSVEGRENFLQIFMETVQQQVGSSFVCLLLHLPGEKGMQIYTASTAPSELYNDYAADIETTYFGGGMPSLNTLGRPVQRDWKGRSLVEFPVAAEQRLLGVFTVQFQNEAQNKEFTIFLQAINTLIVTKLLGAATEVPVDKQNIINILHDMLLMWKPEAYNKGIQVNALTRGLLIELDRSAEELECMAQASLLADYDPELLAGYVGDIPAIGLLRQLQSYRSGQTGENEARRSRSYSFLGKALLMVLWYIERGEQGWRESLPIPINDPSLRTVEHYLSALSASPAPLSPLVSKGNLTSREEETLQLVLQGLNNKEIAEKLYISTHTVKNHITKIYEKLGVNGRAQAISQMYNSSLTYNMKKQ
ncbi:LuxR C-terminal-related transcriptional regulator [Paenibacillus sp. FSL P4-0338]|uniref:LuxR C-terminal-related transcriptional regulator n=1 Tax=unclassified Paenibacillus TaxID=185978 RepID=UPI0009FE1CCC|nr:LuxR C-terminal-related transcriptional regulator [Paenibacillus sp. FSL R7-269]